ncbi:hypothetical protein AA15973_1420 [Komagataeibacter sucrofermentans DSM 15973]|nr:hypothetical protein AA15973_1420 [Komagataeibacter sucrofermentans DSM 15973]
MITPLPRLLGHCKGATQEMRVIKIGQQVGHEASFIVYRAEQALCAQPVLQTPTGLFRHGVRHVLAQCVHLVIKVTHDVGGVICAIKPGGREFGPHGGNPLKLAGKLGGVAGNPCGFIGCESGIDISLRAPGRQIGTLHLFALHVCE